MKLKPGDLQTYYELIKQAEITIEDIEAAIQDWQDDPPDDDYATILEAVIE
ncbi:MAG: hypothetical protein ACRC2V_09610 [Xenococcaceae cyanobacterium]